MTEDERQNLLETVAEAHGGLSEAAFKLRRELTPKAPTLKAAIKAEQEIFRLKRELQRLDIEDLEQAKDRTSLLEVRRGGKAVDVELDAADRIFTTLPVFPVDSDMTSQEEMASEE